MEEEYYDYAEAICGCDHNARPDRQVRQPAYCGSLAHFYYDFGFSGPSALDWVHSQIYDFHNGRLFGSDGRQLHLKDDAKLMDEVWRAHEERTILRFVERATREFKYRLQERMVLPVIILGFARDIYLCRTFGPCSNAVLGADQD